MPDLFDRPAIARPVNLGVELRGTLEAAREFVSRGEPIPESVLCLKERAALIARKVELREAMRPGAASEISRVLTTFVDMRGGYKPGSEEQAKSFNKLRADDLADIPVWALIEAGRAFRRGEIGAGVLRPTEGQLRKHAEDRAAALFVELRDIERVLAAPTVPAPTDATDTSTPAPPRGFRYNRRPPTIGRDRAVWTLHRLISSKFPACPFPPFPPRWQLRDPPASISLPSRRGRNGRSTVVSAYTPKRSW